MLSGTLAGFFTLLFLTWMSGAGTAMASGCIDCHATTVGRRSDVMSRMTATSHHVQGVEVTGEHCYACHWEATAEGGIDERYHAGHLAKKPGTEKAAEVQLVIWNEGKRPTVYKPFSTAVAYQSSAVGSSNERDEVAKITRHCLGCHNDRNNDTRPFDGDIRTPRHYAWDGQSIASRYSQSGVTSWGKYSTLKGNGKMKVVKALSAHGNAAANQGGWSITTGYDGDIPITRGGSRARNVECYDCHNSHGSMIAGTTSSYRSFDGTYNGGILKETQAGKGGYPINYTPSTNPDLLSQNPYNAGAGLCFDCHESAQAGTTPWGYSTFGADQPIIGYKDTLHFGPGVKGSTNRFAGRQPRTAIAGSHLKTGKLLNYSAHGAIRGLCTPCHDPHGVSPSLGKDMPYALPLLKGGWLTSPYREDAPPTSMPTRGAYAGKSSNMNMSWGKGELKAGAADTIAASSYNTDRNTFGEGRRITENESQFGGLCLGCHGKESFTGNRNDRVHRAVKGWGANREHSFPCSKCHQAHNSGLPRLMQTNCLESGPSGLRDSGAAPWIADKSKPLSADTKKNIKEAVVGCHVRRSGKGNSKPSRSNEQTQWKSSSRW
jgi:hypothetical protein